MTVKEIVSTNKQTRMGAIKFKVVHYYIIPWICAIVWWGMLIAMLVAWNVQGDPQYKWNDEYQDPAFISDIGATNLQPLFISCGAFQAIFFVGTLIMEFVLRRMKKLQPYVSTKQTAFSIVSIVCGIAGEVGIIMVTIFKTNTHENVHFSMVGLFIAGTFLACLFNLFNSFIFGNFPTRLSPNHEKVIFGQHRWANVYMVAFFAKVAWLVIALVLAIIFGVNKLHGSITISAIFEWAVSFWYGFILVLWSIDLFPSAVKHYQLRHPEEYPEKDLSNIHLDPNLPEDLTKLEQRSIFSFGEPTYADQSL